MSKELKCICEGNWRLIVSEVEHLFDRTFIDTRDGKEYCFYGLVHGSDDYYYGMWPLDGGRARLLSCVGDLEAHGFELKM